MRWTEGSSKLSTSTPERRSAAWLRSSDPPSRPSPVDTGVCSTVASCVLSASSTPSGSASPTGPSVSVALRGPHRPSPPNSPQHPDTSWVQLTSGGTEIFSTIHSRGGEQRTPLLLSQLSVGRQVVDLEAYCLLHLFATGLSTPPGLSDLNRGEIAQLLSPARDMPSTDRPKAKLQDSDWPLVQALAEDGRASYRLLAMRSHWHESTVRRRVEELIASGVLFFDLDLASDAFGFHSQALLWMSVAPTNLRDVGQALASRPEFPFVAATTGSTNLVAALLCRDDRSLYEFLTGEVAALDGLTHIETSPVVRAVKMHATVTPPR